MSWSKLDLVKKAFAQIGLATYVDDAQPEQIQDALSTMDAMMATWNAEGIRSGYAMSSTAVVDGDVDCGLPDSHYMAVFMNLAIILAAGLGRPVSSDLNAAAKKAYNTVLALKTAPGRVQMPGYMPAGAGNRRWSGIDRPFLSPPCDVVDAGDDAELSFEGKKSDQ